MEIKFDKCCKKMFKYLLVHRFFWQRLLVVSSVSGRFYPAFQVVPSDPRMKVRIMSQRSEQPQHRHKGYTDAITAMTLLVSHKSCTRAHRPSHHLAQTGRQRRCSYVRARLRHTVVSSFTAWWKSPSRLLWETTQRHCRLWRETEQR